MRFGDLSQYGIDDDKEAQLWNVEFDRLVTGLTEAPTSIQDRSSASPSILAEEISPAGFAQLEKLSDQIFCALAIYYCLDDELDIGKLRQARASPDGLILAQSIRKLETRTGFNTVTRGHHTERNDGPDADNFEDDGGDTHGGSVNGALRADALKAVTETEAAAYYTIVDHITLTLARLLVSSEPRKYLEYWNSIFVTILAKISTKLKVLCHDLPAFGLEVLLKNQEYEREMDIDDLLTISGFGVAGYMSDMDEASCWLLRMLWGIMRDLTTRSSR